MAGEGRPDIAETHDCLGRHQLLLPRAVRATRNPSTVSDRRWRWGIVGERDLHLAEEGLVINA
jgi:hypothetical protein